MDKQNAILVYPYNGTLLGNRKEQTLEKQYNIDKPQVSMLSERSQT